MSQEVTGDFEKKLYNDMGHGYFLNSRGWHFCFIRVAERDRHFLNWYVKSVPLYVVSQNWLGPLPIHYIVIRYPQQMVQMAFCNLSHTFHNRSPMFPSIFLSFYCGEFWRLPLYIGVPRQGCQTLSPCPEWLAPPPTLTLSSIHYVKPLAVFIFHSGLPVLSPPDSVDRPSP